MRVEKMPMLRRFCFVLTIGILFMGLLPCGAHPAKAAETLVFGHILNDSTAHHRNMVWAAEEINRAFQGLIF
jgi:TRAP-type C4-dicarboxylate transport system substrate-binding protein